MCKCSVEKGRALGILIHARWLLAGKQDLSLKYQSCKVSMHTTQTHHLWFSCLTFVTMLVLASFSSLMVAGWATFIMHQEGGMGWGFLTTHPLIPRLSAVSITLLFQGIMTHEQGWVPYVKVQILNTRLWPGVMPPVSNREKHGWVDRIFGTILVPRRRVELILLSSCSTVWI